MGIEQDKPQHRERGGFGLFGRKKALEEPSDEGNRLPRKIKEEVVGKPDEKRYPLIFDAKTERKEQNEKAETVDPKSKPIVVIRAAHGPQDRSIHIMSNAIREQLDTYPDQPDKKVAVMIEQSNCPTQIADIFQALIADNNLPTDAYFQTHLLGKYGTEVPESVKGKNAKYKFLGTIPRYTFRQLYRLDKLTKEYPGRINVVLESHAPELASRVHEIYDPSLETIVSYRGSQGKDLKKDDIEAYRNAIMATASLTAKRDEDNAKRITSLIKEDSIIAIVSVEGSTHRTGNLLDAAGYNFIEQLPTIMRKDPAMDLVRKTMSDRTPPTDKEIRDAIQAQTDQYGILPGDSPKTIERKIYKYKLKTRER